MHEAVLEHRLDDVRCALGLGHQRHELRLHVGRESGMLASRDIDAAQRGRTAQDQGRIVRRLDQAACLAHFRDHRLEMLAAGAHQRQLAAGQCTCNEVGAGFDPVRDDGVLRPRQCVDAVHANSRRAGAFDAGSHLGQQIR